MNILRKEGQYSLVENTQSENDTLRYYLDDGEEVTEYFDVIDRDWLMSLAPSEFYNECMETFKPSFKLKRL